MDALSDVLRVAHLTGGVFLHADFFAPWCMAARVAPEHCAPALGPTSHLILYHYVVEGELHVQIEGEDEEGLIVGAGEVVLLPRNDPHLMGSDLSLPPVAGSDIIRPPQGGGLASIHHGGDGARTRMICGFLGCASGEGNPVISTLAGAAQAQRRTSRRRRMDTLDIPLRRGGGLRRKARVGDRARQAIGIVVRGSGAALCGDLAGWSDRMARRLARTHVARALALLHGDITRRWTVDDLSREVGLSRSALADRFIHLIGVPPMHYLASWRMQVATQKLRDTSASLAQVAETGRLQLRGRFLPRIQKGIWCAASYVATFEQLGQSIDTSRAALMDVCDVRRLLKSGSCHVWTGLADVGP